MMALRLHVDLNELNKGGNAQLRRFKIECLLLVFILYRRLQGVHNDGMTLGEKQKQANAAEIFRTTTFITDFYLI